MQFDTDVFSKSVVDVSKRVVCLHAVLLVVPRGVWWLRAEVLHFTGETVQSSTDASDASRRCSPGGT